MSFRLSDSEKKADRPDGLARRSAAIELLVVDVDGVLTDGGIAIDARGDEIKRFHVRDGSGFNLWKRAGKRAAILSGRSARAVDHRAAELGIAPVIQGVAEKAGPFRALIRDLGVAPERVCYIGDDLPDLPVLLAVGLAACPADACAEVRETAHLIATRPGGGGVVREVVETILKHQGRWAELIARHQIPA